MKSSSTFVPPLMPIVGPPEPASWPASCSAVDFVLERIATPLGAEHQLDAVGSERRLDAVHPEVTDDGGVVDLLVDPSDLEAGCLEVVELVLRDAARHERVPGNAGRIAAVDARTGRSARRRRPTTLMALSQARRDEVVERFRRSAAARILGRDVVAPGFVDRATKPANHAERAVRERLLAATAFHVAPADVHRARTCWRRSRPASQPISGSASTGRSGLPQLIVAGLEEVAGRGNLRDRLVVVEHQLRVDVGALAELVVAHRTEGITALRTLVVVQRAEVVQVGAEVEVTPRGRPSLAVR